MTFSKNNFLKLKIPLTQVSTDEKIHPSTVLCESYFIKLIHEIRLLKVSIRIQFKYVLIYIICMSLVLLDVPWHFYAVVFVSFIV